MTASSIIFTSIHSEEELARIRIFAIALMEVLFPGPYIPGNLKDTDWTMPLRAGALEKLMALASSMEATAPPLPTN